MSNVYKNTVTNVQGKIVIRLCLEQKIKYQYKYEKT